MNVGIAINGHHLEPCINNTSVQLSDNVGGLKSYSPSRIFIVGFPEILHICDNKSLSIDFVEAKIV